MHILTNMRTIKKYLFIFLVALGMTGIHSCVTDDVVIPPNGDGDSESFLRLLLDIPRHEMIDAGKGKTRAMSLEAEKVVLPDQLNILVFKEDKFLYMAPIEGNITFENEDKSKISVTVRLVKSKDNNEKFNIYVIANHDISGVTLDQNTTMTSLRESISFSFTEKWNADEENYSPFPMWGESGEIIISSQTSLQAISLYRALARIDVGLNFTFENEKITESASGIENFRMKEVYVYRTYNKGSVIPLSGLNTPNIPSDAVRHADDSPLVYTLPQTGGNKLVREIYVPEADLSTAPTKDDMHCLVVGGYYKGSSNVTYYRLDFANETTMEDRVYHPIRRNHRYIFNITQVVGPGFSSPIDALNSTSTIENLNFDLIEWGQKEITEVDVKGKYYFGVTRHIKMNATKGYTHQVYYDTNFPIVLKEDTITYEWKKGKDSPFRIIINRPSINMLMIATNADNDTNQILSDTLYITSGPFNIPILVEQKFVNFTYSINCSSIDLHGSYILGETINPNEHFIDLSLVFEDTILLHGKEIVLETEERGGNHGINFSCKEILDLKSNPLSTPQFTKSFRLTGNGTLNPTAGLEPFKLRIKSNSSANSYCEVTISPVDDVMNILVLGDINLLHGYSISRLQGGAGKVFNDPRNFGPNDNSIVKMGEINYITSALYDFGGSTGADSYKWVTGIGNNGKIADLVYISFPVVFGNRTAELLIDYLDKGGVIVAFLENSDGAQYLARHLFGFSNINGELIAGIDGGVAGSVYPFPANSTLVPDEAIREQILRQYEGDPILNGPFGDVRDKQWGEDASTTAALYNFPVNDPNVTIYSYRQNLSRIGALPSSDRVVAYKYESPNRNIVWFGDGGFMSSGTSGQNHVSTTICPFYWNETTMFPVFKPVYGATGTNLWQVYNSTAFCNIMAWGVKKSQSLKQKRIEYMNNNQNN